MLFGRQQASSLSAGDYALSRSQISSLLDLREDEYAAKARWALRTPNTNCHTSRDPEVHSQYRRYVKSDQRKAKFHRRQSCVFCKSATLTLLIPPAQTSSKAHSPSTSLKPHPLMQLQPRTPHPSPSTPEEQPASH